MKRNISIILFVFFVILDIYAQKDTFIPNSYLIGNGIIPLHQNSFGKLTEKKINNSLSDSYYETQIIRKKSNRYFVKVNCVNCNNSIFAGWVDMKYVGVGLRNKSSDSIPLYSLPNYKSKKIVVKVHVESIIAVIIDKNGKWLKVYFDNNREKVIGWLAPDNQCYNLFTMCTGD